MMPKLGSITNPSKGLLQEIERVGEQKFDFVEIGIEPPRGTVEIIRKNRGKILSLLKKYGMFAIAHTSWWMDFGTPYENVRKAWVEEAKKKIDMCNELGIKLMNVHFHTQGLASARELGRKEAVRNYIRSMHELVEYGKGKGVGIMLENVPEKFDIYEVGMILDAVKELGFHFDVGHAFVEGGDSKVEEYLRRFRKRIVHIHFHDNFGNRDLHMPLGTGYMSWERVVRMLKRTGYDRTVTFEVFSNDQDFLLYSRRKFREVWRMKKGKKLEKRYELD